MAKRKTNSRSTSGFVAPPSGLRVGGRTYKAGQPIPAKYGRMMERGKLSQDPAMQKQSDAAPNFGRLVIPQVFTFSGRTSVVGNVYKNPDEAVRTSIENARIMRNDTSIMECLEARQRATALLNWHIEPDDKKDPKQVALADMMTKVISATPQFTEYRRNLLEALWYGRYAVQHGYGFMQRAGKRFTTIKDWEPINGDKLVFGFDDQSGRFQKDRVGIKVTPAFRMSDALAGDRRLDVTEAGQVYFLEDWERSRVAIHKHIIEDGSFEDPLSAGRIHGVGIRDRIYWTWYQKQETMAHMMEIIERTGSGFTIYWYPAGDAKAQAEVEKIAQEGNRSNVLIMPRMPGDDAAYGVDRIEPNSSGVDTMRQVIGEFFGHQIKRYILGQTLSSEAAGTGLGSGVADIQADTFAQIIQYDAVKLEETITNEVLQPLKAFNAPWAHDIPLYFKIDTQSAESEKKMQAYRQAWEMGAKLKASDVMDIIGASMPTGDDIVLQNPAMMQMPPGNGGDQGAIPAGEDSYGEQMTAEELFGEALNPDFQDDGQDGDDQEQESPQKYARQDEIKTADDWIHHQIDRINQGQANGLNLGRVKDFWPRSKEISAKVANAEVIYRSDFRGTFTTSMSRILVGRGAVNLKGDRTRTLGTLLLNTVTQLDHAFGSLARYAKTFEVNNPAEVIAPGGHHIGATKTENGVTYRLNENHRWELAHPKEVDTNKHKDGDFQSSYDVGSTKDFASKSLQTISDPTLSKTLAAFHGKDRSGLSGNKVRGILQNAIQTGGDGKGPRVQLAGGEITQAVRAHGGLVVDLGEGRIGFASSAGSIVIHPGEGGKSKVVYAHDTGLVRQAMQKAGSETEDAGQEQQERTTPPAGMENTQDFPSAEKPAEGKQKDRWRIPKGGIPSNKVAEQSVETPAPSELTSETVSPPQPQPVAKQEKPLIDQAVDALRRGKGDKFFGTRLSPAPQAEEPKQPPSPTPAHLSLRHEANTARAKLDQLMQDYASGLEKGLTHKQDIWHRLTINAHRTLANHAEKRAKDAEKSYSDTKKQAQKESTQKQDLQTKQEKQIQREKSKTSKLRSKLEALKAKHKANAIKRANRTETRSKKPKKATQQPAEEAESHPLIAAAEARPGQGGYQTPDPNDPNYRKPLAQKQAEAKEIAGRKEMLSNIDSHLKEAGLQVNEKNRKLVHAALTLSDNPKMEGYIRDKGQLQTMLSKAAKLQSESGSNDDFEHLKKAVDQRAHRKPKVNLDNLMAENADAWGMTPEEYKEVASDYWSHKNELWQAREDAKKAGRDRLGINAAGIERLNNKGEDYAGPSMRGKNMDVWADAIAGEYPQLGWQQGDSSNEGKLWELINEGSNPLPQPHEDEYHDEVHNHLAGLYGDADEYKAFRRNPRQEEAFDDSFDPSQFAKNGFVIRYKAMCDRHRMKYARQLGLWDEEEHPRNQSGEFASKRSEGAPASRQKERHEMTKKEVIASGISEKAGKLMLATHERKIAEAIHAGKHVPEEVLAEYPDFDLSEWDFESVDLEASKESREKIYSDIEAKKAASKAEGERIVEQQREEYIQERIATRHLRTLKEHLNGAHPKRNPGKFLANEHREAVEEAVREGKKIPDEVLADYPDLALLVNKSKGPSALKSPNS